MQRNDIQQETEKLQTVGTSDQRDYEKSVLYYQKKVNQFAGLLASHQFASNVFSFLQEQTMPNVWFSQFGLDQKNNAVQLTGESETMDAFSRQVATFEKNKYVKSIGTLNTALVNSARVGFNIKLTLDQNIFSYISGDSSILETTTP